VSGSAAGLHAGPVIRPVDLRGPRVDSGLFAGCGKSLPPQDAAMGDPLKPRLFVVSPK
jgi:hypothetical protein